MTETPRADDGRDVVSISLLDIGPPSAAVAAVLVEQAGLAAEQVAELFGPARLPEHFTDADARKIAAALQAAGANVQVELTGQDWREPPGAFRPDIALHPGASERP